MPRIDNSLVVNFAFNQSLLALIKSENSNVCTFASKFLLQVYLLTGTPFLLHCPSPKNVQEHWVATLLFFYSPNDPYFEAIVGMLRKMASLYKPTSWMLFFRLVYTLLVRKSFKQNSKSRKNKWYSLQALKELLLWCLFWTQLGINSAVLKPWWWFLTTKRK